jgi:uncharacterized protein
MNMHHSGGTTGSTMQPGGVFPISPGRPPFSSALETVRGIYRAFSQGNVPQVLGVLDPEVEWIPSPGHPFGGPFRGPEQVLERVFMRLVSEWDDFRAQPEEFLTSDRHVVVLGTYLGTSRATGRELCTPFAHVWRVERGRVASFRQITDTHLVRTAMGM